MATQLLTVADTGRTIRAAPGDELIVSLAEQPSTGYRWMVELVDEQQLHLRDTFYAGGGRPGAAGMRQLTFVVAQAGLSELRLKHWRPWSGESSVVARFAVTVEAHL
jgi:inhibitor of cysteine peptidase